MNELTKEKKRELEKLIEDYVINLHYINYFIEENGLDYDEIWDEANQAYDEDLSIAAENN